MIDFNKYFDDTHIEEVTIKKYLKGILITKKIQFTSYRVTEIKDIDYSLDVYLLGINIWHQEKIVRRGRNGEVKAYL